MQYFWISGTSNKNGASTIKNGAGKTTDQWIPVCEVGWKISWAIHQHPSTMFG